MRTPDTARSAGREHNEPRLTLNVNEVDEAKRPREDGTERELVVGTLKLGGAFRVDRDLLRREDLVVTVRDLDGVVVAEGGVRVAAPSFHDIEDRGRVIGIERRHKATLVELP